jgi:high-affinity iron transporter
MTRKKTSFTALWVAVATVLVAGVLVWQGVTASGAPDPGNRNLSPFAAVIDTGILVFREGLESVLVLAAIITHFVRTQSDYWKPVAVGAGLSFLATWITWFVVVGIVDMAGNATSELNVQAATGLLANVVLLVIMNWFFHKIYWTGWISHHNQKKRALLALSGNHAVTYRGLVILGLTSMYREGFEVVLFLQNLRLEAGSRVVFLGAMVGLALTFLAGVLTFFAHQKLPYKNMLVVTGVLLGIVLFVMTGETVQEMQQAGWIPTTRIPVWIPGWASLWFSVIPTVETMVSQVLAVVLVVGSYGLYQYLRVWRPRKQAAVRDGLPH